MTEHLRNYWGKLRGGDLGALPAIFGLVALCTYFGFQSDAFLSAGNLANLLTQAAPIIIISMGIVFVLLLGEIDLSAGWASGVAAAVLAVAIVRHGQPWWVAVLLAILTGVVLGMIIGLLVAKLNIPSFVVTLAAFLAFQGVILKMLDEGTNISIPDNIVVSIGSYNMTPNLGWILGAVGVGGYALIQIWRWFSRSRRGVSHDSLALTLGRIGLVAVIIGAVIYVLNLERAVNPLIASVKGVPNVVPVIAVLLIVWTFVLRRTAYGRHIYAVGGNREAARRAGIPVDRIRISAFVICSAMAAVGGIITAGHDHSVDANTGGANILLYAVGAAVIGGTSLFGGRGRVLDAVLGGLVIAIIINGLGLLGAKSSERYLFMGAALLLAAGVDAISRRRIATAG